MTGVFRRRADAQRQVDALGDQIRAAVVEQKQNADVRITFREPGHQRQQMMSSKGRRGPDPNDAARPLDEFARTGADLLIAVEQQLGLAQRMGARLGEADMLGRAIEEFGAERLFEPSDVFGRGRFRHAQPARRAREAAVAGDLNEYLDAAKAVHRCSPVSKIETISLPILYWPGLLSGSTYRKNDGKQWEISPDAVGDANKEGCGWDFRNNRHMVDT